MLQLLKYLLALYLYYGAVVFMQTIKAIFRAITNQVLRDAHVMQ